MAEPRTQTITIANGATDSPVVLLQDQAARRAYDGDLFAPATLPETITIQVADTVTNQVWRTQQSGGVDVAVAAGKAVPLLGLVAASMRLHASAAVGGDRVFSWIAVARSGRD